MIIRETQIKTIMWYHFIPIKRAITPKSENKCLQGHEESGTHVYCWWGYKAG